MGVCQFYSVKKVHAIERNILQLLDQPIYHTYFKWENKTSKYIFIYIE